MRSKFIAIAFAAATATPLLAGAATASEMHPGAGMSGIAGGLPVDAMPASGINADIKPPAPTEGALGGAQGALGQNAADAPVQGPGGATQGLEGLPLLGGLSGGNGASGGLLGGLGSGGGGGLLGSLGG